MLLCLSFTVTYYPGNQTTRVSPRHSYMSWSASRVNSTSRNLHAALNGRGVIRDTLRCNTAANIPSSAGYPETVPGVGMRTT
jgi:hypothetical protein